MAPNDDDLRRAQDIVAIFEAARERGEARVEYLGSLIEMPIYLNAKRVLTRGEEMRHFMPSSGSITPA
jgi:citrate lyase subunit beta / citryl-CoA lyase